MHGTKLSGGRHAVQGSDGCRRYSTRSATVGSIRAARRAGT